MRRAWLGDVDDATVVKYLRVLATHFPTLPIDVGPTPPNVVAEVPGRSKPFPALAADDVDGKRRAMVYGMTIGPRWMPSPMRTGPAYRFDGASVFTKRVWTIIHEGSHSILGTYDYVYYDEKPITQPGKSAQAKLEDFTAPGNTHTGPRALGGSDTFPGTAARRNADSWAGFVMHASQYLYVQAAMTIQRAARRHTTPRAVSSSQAASSSSSSSQQAGPSPSSAPADREGKTELERR
jgi:hypothetical protein